MSAGAGRNDADQGARCAPFGLSGGDLLTETIRQAETLASGPWRVHNGCLATPAPFRLAKEGQTSAEVCAQALAEAVELDGTWFSQAVPAGGYLNLVFAPEWYDAAAQEPAQAGTPVTSPVPPVPAFPAEIFPGDWRCLCRTQKKQPAPQLAARQDAGNPAWLVRYTAERLHRLAERSAPLSQVWTEEERTLLRLAAEFAQRQERDTPAQLFRYLVELARQVWQVRCFTGGAALRCARVLAAGYGMLAQP